MSDCIFCKIVAGEVPCYKLSETDDVLSFLDIMPITRGHLLVIPTRHIERAWDMPPELMGAVAAEAARLAERVHAAVNCKGMNIIMNCGSIAGQVVPHAHMHVVPRYAGDGIRFPWPQGDLTDETAQGLVALLRDSE